MIWAEVGGKKSACSIQARVLFGVPADGRSFEATFQGALWLLEYTERLEILVKNEVEAGASTIFWG